MITSLRLQRQSRDQHDGKSGTSSPSVPAPASSNHVQANASSPRVWGGASLPLSWASRASSAAPPAKVCNTPGWVCSRLQCCITFPCKYETKNGTYLAWNATLNQLLWFEISFNITDILITITVLVIMQT